MSVPNVYVLTDITRRSSEQRRVVVSGFDVRWRTVVIAMIGAPPGVILAAFGWMFIGEMAILAIPATVMALYYLVEARSRSGLGLPMWRMLVDRKTSSVGRFFLCGVEIDPLDIPVVNVVRSTVPVDHDRELDHERALGIDI